MTQELVAGQTHRALPASAQIVTAANSAGVPALSAGAQLAWFLLFPSLGIVQKYLGTGGAFAYFGIGGVLLTALSVRAQRLASEIKVIGDPWTRLAIVVKFGALAVALVMFYASARNGNDRGDSLNVGIHELLAGRYPYYQTTRFHNVVTQMPGSLLLAAPFALLGNAAWQNLFWLAALFLVVRSLLGDHRAVVLMALIFLGSPAVLQDFVAGGDLGASTIALLMGMLALVTLVPNASTATWKKVAAAVFTGVALSSRMNYLLLVPPLLAALSRRASVADAIRYLCVTGVAFAAVTVPFYWYDPIEFAPLHLHNKFAIFGEVPSGWILFPAISVLASVVISTRAGNRTVPGWLMQSAFVMTIPVVFLVALASYRLGRPDFVFADYALASVFLGGIGAALRLDPPFPSPTFQ